MRPSPVRAAALLAVLVLPLAAPLPAQQTAARAGDPSLLTLDRIFASGEFAAEWAGDVKWLADGSGYTLLEPSSAISGAADLVRYSPADGSRTVLVTARQLVPAGQSRPLEVEEYTVSDDGRQVLVYTNSARVWRQNTRGDYWVLDLASGRLRKLGGPDARPSTLMFAKLSPDGTRVAYVRENDLYVEGVADGRITRLTTDGSRTTINGTFDWVYEEELSLRDGFRWSPDGQRIAYWQLDASGVRDFLLINNTDSLYSFVVPVQYPKAGTTNSAARIGVVSAAGGPTRWLEIPGDPRNNYLARMEWAASPGEVVVQQLNRRQNTLNVILGDAATGRVRTVLTERDSAWVDVVDEWDWLEGGRRFLWSSERDGWRHLYTVSRDGRDVRLITPGQFDVVSVESVDAAGGWVYFIASPENVTQRYLWRTRLDGSGRPERVTPATQPGTHQYDIAPGGRWALHSISRFDDPPRTDVVALPDHRSVRTLVDNAPLRARLAALKPTRSEFTRVDAGGGVQLDAWVIHPPEEAAGRRYPVLFYVYGEPGSTTVNDEWDGSMYLFHRMLAQQGYVVASVDPRGTPAPRGRAFRKAQYRQVGVLNARDEVMAARSFARRPFADSTRLAMWGWSGGGSTTLNAMLQFPGVFGTAMAVAPIADLRYYDTIYQERYMGLPQENPEDYRRGSAVTYASGLQGNLLLVHGTGDDNVHYQNTEAMANALIAANKQFRMQAYPNRTHGIYEGKNTTRHLFTLLATYLGEKVPAGAR